MFVIYSILHNDAILSASVCCSEVPSALQMHCINHAGIYTSPLSCFYGPQVSNVSSWVLAWRFSSGERIQAPGDVFGDPGNSDVYISQGTPQEAAVFSE